MKKPKEPQVEIKTKFGNVKYEKLNLEESPNPKQKQFYY